MIGRYDIQPRHAKPRYDPVGKWRITRNVDGCLNCGKCASACLYDVHKRRADDYRIMAEPEDHKCRNCWMCVQECPAQVLTMTENDAYRALGDDLYTPDIIAGIWRVAEKGEVPVSGCGYGGPYSGQGYDAMWTDMSEIVRPTRDGIHGREFISTAVDLGYKPGDVTGFQLDPLADGMRPIVEIKVPIVFNRFSFYDGHPRINLSMVKAASELHTFAILDSTNITEELAAYDANIIEHLSRQRSWDELMAAARKRAIVEVDLRDDLPRLVDSLKGENPNLAVMVRVDTRDDAPERVCELARSELADIIHLHSDFFRNRLRNVEGEARPLPESLPWCTTPWWRRSSGTGCRSSGRGTSTSRPGCPRRSSLGPMRWRWGPRC